MTRTPFNDGWTVADGASPAAAVVLPHDAMISTTRAAKGTTGSHGGYFPGGRYLYAKTWTPPADIVRREFSLFFEGVYGATEVRVDGHTVATSVSGYREFSVPLVGLAPGRPVLIELAVDNSAVPNSRWYTGSGIYRKVWLDEVGAAHIAHDGVSVTTALAGTKATVRVVVDIEQGGTDELTARVTLAAPNGRRFDGVGIVQDSRAHLDVVVDDPQLWSEKNPHLHAAVVELRNGNEIVDEQRLFVGLRTVTVDAEHGLRINGESVLLRGACVHHDNGLLGAATFRTSEYRRASILKSAGFNAVRSSHNPLSRDFLDACDEIGLYVLDELTDIWFGSKSTHDVAPHFDEIWRDDARSMVAKDRNHPSVIMYSIGNEIAESGTERGVSTAHELSDFIRSLDHDRPTTIAVNFLLNVMAASGRSLFDTSEHDPEKVDRKPSAATSTVANVMANRIGSMMQVISKLPKADKVSRDTFKAVDVAGYNYAWGRYRGDAKRHPNRVILGTESMPGDITRIWPLVESVPSVIGDFVWTGWDYLGESGIGTWSYGDDTVGIGKAYPELVAGCGLVDITGRPGAAMLLSQAAWNQLKAPQIAVHPLDRSGEKVHRVAWRSTDAVQSWAWVGCEGRIAEIDVYSTDDHVELLINGRSLGRKAAGARNGYVTRFRTPYEKGELVAIGYRGAVEVSRSTLRSAGKATLRLTPESERITPDGQDLAYVWVEIADSSGMVEMLDDDEVVITVDGPAELIGLGSAATATDESFTDARHTTWRGRALAILRSTGVAGEIVVTATSHHHGTAGAEIAANQLGLSAPSVV